MQIDAEPTIIDAGVQQLTAIRDERVRSISVKQLGPIRVIPRMADSSPLRIDADSTIIDAGVRRSLSATSYILLPGERRIVESRGRSRQRM